MLLLQSSRLTNNDWFTEALPLLNEAIEQHSELAIAYMLRGLAQVESGNLEAARADLEQARELHQTQGNQFGVDNADRATQVAL